MTLTQAAGWTKKGLVGFVISIILITIASVGYNMWYQYQLAQKPPVEEKPEMKFGALPKITFPASSISPSNYSYALDTVTGGLPQTPKLIKVYFIPLAGVSLLAPDKAQKLAGSLGFPNGPETLSSSKYRFTEGGKGELSIDVATGNFRFQRSISTDSASLFKNPFVDKAQTINEFRNFLASKGLLDEEIKNSRAEVNFSKSSPAESDNAEISLWPADLDKFPIVTINPRQGLIRATMTHIAEEANRFIKVDYTLWPIDKTTSSTYPLKTAEQALADLRAGVGFISLEPSKPQVSISSIYLAYFQSENYTPYLQPIFVFEGPDFMALVPAVAE